SKFKLNHTKKYTLTTKEPFEAILQYILKKSNKKKGVLVLDNLEAVIGLEKLMEELANIIILLDDERYSQYKVKIVLVGTPSNIREYFKQQSSKATIINRLIEVPELPRFSRQESSSLIEKGFKESLRYQFSDFDSISEHIHFVTDGIPDKLHDYCLILARSTPNLNITEQDLKNADAQWLKQHLSDAYQTIVSSMNARNTEVGRRNQVLYALGKITSSEFNYQAVENIVRQEFPVNTTDTQLAIGQILTELSTEENGILKRSQKKDAYLFKDPVYKMAIRSILKKKSDETVERIFIEDVFSNSN
ncbi:ATP-binding protein, partial [Leptospira wolffii]